MENLKSLPVKIEQDGLCKFRNVLVDNLYVGNVDNYFQVKEVTVDNEKIQELEERIDNFSGSEFLEIKEPVVIEKRYFIENKNNHQIPIDDQVKIEMATMLTNDVKKDIDETNTNILQLNADQKNLHQQFQEMNDTYRKIIDDLKNRLEKLERGLERPESAGSRKVSFNGSKNSEAFKRLTGQKK